MRREHSACGARAPLPHPPHAQRVVTINVPPFAVQPPPPPHVPVFMVQVCTPPIPEHGAPSSSRQGLHAVSEVPQIEPAPSVQGRRSTRRVAGVTIVVLQDPAAHTGIPHTRDS